MAHQEHLWGIYDETAMRFLRDLETAHPGMPVLPLVFSEGGRAVYHTIYRGRPITHDRPFDKAINRPGTYDMIQIHGSVDVVLAIQGFSEHPVWTGAGPTAQELTRYQKAPKEEARSYDAMKMEQWVSREGGANVPIAAHLRQEESGPVMYAIWANANLRAPKKFLPYERSKVLATAAMGGYWYSAATGVGFRAFLRGHYGVNNSWTGQCLGWRMTYSGDFEYTWIPPDGGDVKQVFMIGGVVTDDDLAQVNSRPLATGLVYVDSHGSHFCTEVHQLEWTKQNMETIYLANGGRRLFAEAPKEELLIDTMLPSVPEHSGEMDAEEASLKLYSSVHEDDEDYIDF